MGVIFLNNYVLNNFLQNLLYRAVSKPGIFLSEMLGKVSKYGGSFFNRGAVVKENDELKKENNVLLGGIAELESLKRENDFLRNELEVAPRLDSKLLIVEIFSVQKNGLFSTALINKGRANGVEKSMAVITSGNILAGTISEVFENSALVLLIDDPRSAVSVRFQGSNILAEAKGNLQDGLKINEITYQEEIKEGDMIVTSGLDGLKESLLVGRVSEVKAGSGGLFREVIAKPLFDLSLGSDLFVILQ
jgi:rod shape-determining protein MreC